MKFPLPIQIPAGGKPTITQPFGPTNVELEPAGPNGEPHFHYGVDIVLGDDHATFGAALRCPFPFANVINRHLAPQGSGETSILQLAYTTTDEHKYNLSLIHCSEMEQTNAFQYGDLVAKIGNTGTVTPEPSLKDPYAGAHLHLGLQVDGVWVDPELYFDFTKWFAGAGPDQQDQLPATNWLITELLALVNKIAHA